jgi:hypothetical protein
VNVILYTDDFTRGERYEDLGPMVITADWRGAVGFMRSRDRCTLICELSSARSIDVLRAVMGDPELIKNHVIGVAVDPETVETARRMGFDEIVAEDDLDGLAARMGGRS